MSYEFDGKKYEQASAHQKEWGAALVAELDLIGAERVLDLGCGDGVLTSRIADLVPQGEVLGIDASQGMINAALAHTRANLHFQKLDIGDLDFEDAFDVVFSNATLHWVKDHKRLMRNVQRALRAGGRLRFQFAGDGNCANFFAVVREAMERDEFREFFTTFEWPWYLPTVEEYQVLAQASELHGVRVWGENADRYFADAEAMMRWIDQPSLVPFLAHLPEAARETFRNFVVNLMIQRTRGEDGRCFETFRRINLAATK